MSKNQDILNPPSRETGHLPNSNITTRRGTKRRAGAVTYVHLQGYSRKGSQR